MASGGAENILARSRLAAGLGDNQPEITATNPIHQSLADIQPTDKPARFRNSVRATTGMPLRRAADEATMRSRSPRHDGGESKNTAPRRAPDGVESLRPGNRPFQFMSELSDETATESVEFE